MTKTKKGYITITLALSIGVALIGGVATFFKTSNATDKEIGKTNTRVSVVETQISNILRSQEKMELGIEEIKRILMEK